MSKHFSPERSLFRNHAKPVPGELAPETSEEAFTRRKKAALSWLLTAVIALPVALLCASLAHSFADPYAIGRTGGEAFWATISGLAFAVFWVSLFAAVVTRIVAGIKR